nr:ubiquitin-conjugating enzyme E2 Z-like [Rhipicephalus microplus]
MYAKETPSQECLHRVKRDLAEFHADPPPGVFMAPEEDNLTTVHAVVMGTEGTSYQGGFFHLLMKCTNAYPMSPPKVRFMTTDGGRVTFIPHISAGGHICLSLLGTMAGPPWTPALNMTTVAVSIQSMLDDNIDCVDSAFEHIITGYWAVLFRLLCETSCSPSSPKTSRSTRLVAKEELAKNQGGILAWFGAENKYQTLLTRLQKLKERVDERNGANKATAVS